MAKKKSFPSIVSRSGWLAELDPADWVRLQVYPDAVRHAKTARDHEQKARSLLVKSGRANLRHLCTEAGIGFNPERDSAEKLAERLLDAECSNELVYLCTFLRRRKTALVEYFDLAVGEREADALASEIAAHSDRRPEIPKPLTKLVTLYRSSPDHLESIHYRHAWRRLPTVFAYEAPDGIDSEQVKVLTQNLEGLVGILDKLKPGESYEVFGHSKMTDDMTVFVVHRKYPPSVRADYLNNYRLQHDFSTVVFSVNELVGTISVKVGNRALADEIRSWIATTLTLDLRRAGSSLFSDYSPESVEEAFLGGYDESSGIDILKISFSQSFGPNRSPLSLEVPAYSKSVREDLLWLKKSRVVRLRSLSDITSFQLRFEDQEIDVQAVPEPGGAVRFRMIDSGLTETLADSLRSAFRETFLIPLDQSIDPTLLAMGPADIYHFLLGGVTEKEVQPYQSESLEELIKQGLLEAVDEKSGRCTDFQCKHSTQPVTDDALTECPACQGELKWEGIRRYQDDKKATIGVVRSLLKKATGWKIAANKISLESHDFYRLSSPKHPSKTVCVFVNDRVSSGKMDTFLRAMFPVIIVHPQGQQRVPVVDANGIAHVGLPHMLAASENSDDWKKFKEASQEVLPRLISLESERVLRASRLSHDKLLAPPVGYDDRSYEADVFNTLRSMFPFTVKWGGGNKPDGFSSLVYFPNNDLSEPVTYNWSYDAKYSESTYAFGATENRQMFDYVRRLYASKRLKSLGNRYDAHVIITNSMDESAMMNAAEFMATQSRLGLEFPDFQLAFMRDSFLTTLWGRLRAEESEFDNAARIWPSSLFVLSVTT